MTGYFAHLFVVIYKTCLCHRLFMPSSNLRWVKELYCFGQDGKPLCYYFFHDIYHGDSRVLNIDYNVPLATEIKQ